MTQHFTHRGIRYGLALLIAASVAGVTTSGFSQNVPIPKPAPKGRDGGVQMSAQDSQKGTTANRATQTPPNPIIPDPNRNVPTNIFATFDANQTKGDFYIQKPGKLRFEYDDPSPIAVVADGSSLVVRDRKLATQDVYP